MRSVLDEKQQNLFSDLTTQENDVLTRMESNLRKIQDNLNRTQQMLSNVQKRLDYQDVYAMLKVSSSLQPVNKGLSGVRRSIFDNIIWAQFPDPPLDEKRLKQYFAFAWCFPERRGSKGSALIVTFSHSLQLLVSIKPRDFVFHDAEGSDWLNSPAGGRLAAGLGLAPGHQAVCKGAITCPEGSSVGTMLEVPPMISGDGLASAGAACMVSLWHWNRLICGITGKNVPTYLTLNANSAHPRLLLSEDLTVVTYGDVKQEVRDNPERFDTCVCVLGSEAFTSGKHYWEVQVGSKTEWDLGVVKESINRKGHTTATPDSGYWIVWLRNGNEYKATTVPRTRLNVARKPRAIGVYLDYEGGQVSFYNVDDMSHLYTFIDTFTGKLFPYFSPGINDDGENSEPLRILPVR
eukprot:g47316.t1